MNADKVYSEMIAKEYVPKLYYKMIALKKLDRKAKKRATAVACAFGSVLAVMLDAGLCLSAQAAEANDTQPVYHKHRDKAHRLYGVRFELPAL